MPTTIPKRPPARKRQLSLISVAKPAPRAPRKPPLSRVVAVYDPLAWASWQPPSEKEWAHFVCEVRRTGSKILNSLIDRDVAPAGVDHRPQKENQTHLSKGNPQMKLKVKGVPAGQYGAIYAGVDETEHAEYGAGLIWRFTIAGGDYDGQEATRITGPDPTPKNACGKIVKGLLGSLPGPGCEIDVSEPVGRKYSILVEESQNGGTRIAAVVPLPKQ